MYGCPADPTFNNTLLRELRAKGRKCANCQHNIAVPTTCGVMLSTQRQCRYDHAAYPKGPCIHHDEAEQ